MKKLPRFAFAALALTILSAHIPAAQAQDYPYEDEGSDKAEAPAKPAPRNNDLPRESPDEAPGGKTRRLPALFRVGFKAGSEFTILQASDDTGLTSTIHGVGASGLVSFGWDLPYQPVFLSLESGYRGLLLNNSDRIHVIPLQMGVYRRFRTGRNELLKLGVTPSLDFRIARQADGTTGYSLVPSIAFNLIYEWGGFMLQPGFTLYRVRGGQNFLSFGGMAGYFF